MINRTDFTDNLNRLTLNFPDEREQKYREYHFDSTVVTTRIAVIVVSLIYIFFGYLDSIVAGDLFKPFIIIRIIVVSAFLFVVGLSFTTNLNRYWQTLILILYLIGSVGIIIMLVLLPEAIVYSSGLILVFLSGAVLVKLRFILFSIGSWIAVFIYLIAAFIMNVDYGIVISNGFFFISANLIGMFAAYTNERFNRQNFNLYLQIAKKNELIEHANRNLEDKVEERTKLLNFSNKELREEVSRRALIEKELITAKEKAEESDKLKSAFLANMSHEIRTPMNGILGFANLLHEAESAEEFDEFVNTIIKSGEHLLNLINDIIDLSKIEAGILKIEETQFELNRLTKEIYDMFCINQHIVERNIQLTYRDGLPDDNCLIVTDRIRLKQILINVVNNACKYTDKGSIEFYYKIDEDNLIFVVKDTGIGIPQESQKFIFDRFMQASNGKTMGRESTGLGLSITKTYLNLMGGNITVKSEIDTGSEFTFNLPNIFETHKSKTNDTIELGR